MRRVFGTGTTARPSVRAVGAWLCGAMVLTSCGGAPPPPDPNEAFHRIQLDEAVIAHRSAAARRCHPGQACPAAAEIRSAADRICAIASQLDDPDANARCELARRESDHDRASP